MGTLSEFAGSWRAASLEARATGSEVPLDWEQNCYFGSSGARPGTFLTQSVRPAPGSRLRAREAPLEGGLGTRVGGQQGGCADTHLGPGTLGPKPRVSSERTVKVKSFYLFQERTRKVDSDI